jgi:uncharacterized RDD family membrane protein YckC
MDNYYKPEGQADLLQHMDEAPEVQYAGFWLRFAAYVIDAVVLYAVIFITALVLGIGFSFLDENGDLQLSPLLVLVYLPVILYFPLMESSAWQATLGKRAVNIKVTDMDGNRISFGKALGRFFAKLLSATILYIGFFMAGFTERKQALHDMVASTLVVRS